MQPQNKVAYRDDIVTIEEKPTLEQQGRSYGRKVEQKRSLSLDSQTSDVDPNQILKRVFNCFFNLPQLSKVVSHGLLCAYNSSTDEIFIGQNIDYDREGQDDVLVFDKSLREVDSLRDKSLFDKYIIQITPTQNGNALVLSGGNENKVVYWDREKKQAFEIKRFGTNLTHLFNVRCDCSERVAYSPGKQKIYVADRKTVEVYEVDGTPIEAIDLHLMACEGIVRIFNDDDLNKVFIVAMDDMLVQRLAEYNFSTKLISWLDCFPEHAKNLRYISEKKWLVCTRRSMIGYCGDEIIVILDLHRKVIAKEKSIHGPRLYIDVFHYVPEKNSMFFVVNRNAADFEDKKFQEIVKWDIEADNLSIPFLVWPKKIKRTEPPYQLSWVSKIDYDPKSDVLVIRSNREILAWHLSSGRLIHPVSENNQLKSDFIWDKVAEKFITFDSIKEVLEVRSY